jgi:hypothetical protein
MDNSLQYKAMRKLLMSLVKPKYDKIIDNIKVVALSQISDTPTIKVYLSPNLLSYVSVENSSGVTFEDIQELTGNIDWKITESLKHMGSPRYWVEFIQTQP